MSVCALLLHSARVEAAQVGVESRPLSVAGNHGPGFTLMPPEKTGITFSNAVNSFRSIHTLIASGVAAADIDGDGLCDLFFCSQDGTNILYRNLGGWRFEDMTARAGVACPGQHSIGATFADVNGDSFSDLIVTARGGPNRLFINDGKGHFTEDMTFPGRESKYSSTSIAVADVNGDGWPDIYICNYQTHSYIDEHLEADAELNEELKRINEGRELSPKFRDRFYLANHSLNEKGEPDELLLNDGHGHFHRADESYFKMPPGALPPGPLEGSGLAAQFHDFNGDGFPDLYVCNDFVTPDRLWLNDGTGHFTLAGTEVFRHMSSSSMQVDVADVNLDGHMDFFVGDMLSRDYPRRQRQRDLLHMSAAPIDNFGTQPQYAQNTFFVNRGGNTFAEIAPFAGLTASEWTWGAIFLDADLDGYPDLLISCGNLQDLTDADAQLKVSRAAHSMEDMKKYRSELPALKNRCQLFRNNGDLHFTEVGAQYGFKVESAHGGMTVCDLDNDGDLDVVINNANGQPEIYRNEAAAPRIAVKLRGRAPNTGAIGARVELVGKKTQTQEVIAGGRYASGGDGTLMFAMRPDWSPYKLRVTWRDGSLTEVPALEPNRLYIVTQTNVIFEAKKKIPQTLPLFEDASAELSFTNYTGLFNDFEIQPLLPNRLSRAAPGVSWFDLDGDGRDDLIIGAAANGVMGIFKNLGGGHFQLFDETNQQIHARHEQTAVLGIHPANGGVSLALGISSWGDPKSELGMMFLRRGLTNNWLMGPGFTRGRNITGPVALADVDGNGCLDFFVGGRVLAGSFPAAADSVLVLQDEQGGFVPIDSAASGLKNPGMVTSAVFADVNGDGRPDLIVGCEWGPLQLLLNSGLGFTNATRAWGLDRFAGLWNSVAVGDFDGDGRIDFVASNWGQNSRYEGEYDAAHPLKIFYGDFNEMGRTEIVEAHQDFATGRWLPERDLSDSAAAVPSIRGRIASYQEFSEADIVQIYGERITNTLQVEARELRSMMFLNRGDHFEAVPLPVEAQWSPAFGVTVADFNGDGHDDIFLAQNFFSAQPETFRNDAGRGLLLLGDGQGGLRAASAAESGVAIYGEQRGSAACDYDGDGRMDLAVGQSNDKTVLLHNRTAKPGLRVRLQGPVGNSECIGAVVRAVTPKGLGRAQVITAGSGWRSQDSATLIVTSPQPIIGLKIRWPNGVEEERPVSPEEKSVVFREPAAANAGRH